MKVQKLIITALLILVVCCGAIIALFSLWPEPIPDVVALNDLIKTSEEQSWEVSRLTEEMNQLYKNTDEARQARDTSLVIGVITIIVSFTAGIIAIMVMFDRRSMKPFREMEQFAQSVASGNLDVPLLENRSSGFGAFTESFDLMRTELARAKEAERQANQSKKELIASLSHDIKTPLASIKASSELTLVTTTNQKDKQAAATIIAKADQVTALVDNLFTSTMEELHELEVSPGEVSQNVVANLLSQSDYRKQATIAELPDCLIVADEKRLAQVFDNIFSNSYKYADTPLEVTAHLDGETLVLDITDFGTDVAEEEIALLTQKFYRGSNAGDKSGVGLGLYNAALFMEGMGGGLVCFREQNRFTVRVVLRLA